MQKKTLIGNKTLPKNCFGIFQILRVFAYRGSEEGRNQCFWSKKYACPWGGGFAVEYNTSSNFLPHADDPWLKRHLIFLPLPKISIFFFFFLGGGYDFFG